LSLEHDNQQESPTIHPKKQQQQLPNSITMDDYVKLNVEGQLFATNRATLCA
jgi:hypothetical protein